MFVKNVRPFVCFFLLLITSLLITAPLAVDRGSLNKVLAMESPDVVDSLTADCNVPEDYNTIQEAVNDANCVMISVDKGVFDENVTIDRRVSIAGQGAANTEVNGTAAGSVFIISSGGIVNLTGLLITNGSGLLGGGVFNRGNLTIDKSTISDSSANEGGGVHNEGGTMTIDNSAIIDNSAHFGGGIATFEGMITINNSTISGNSAKTYGGGISGTLGAVTISNSTIIGNSTDERGGGIAGYSSVVVSNSIVANNQGNGDCVGDKIISQGYNLDSDNTCNLTATGDLPNRDPLLGPLQDNGGATFTHALLSGSPAIDAGNCPSAVADQRDFARPADMADIPNVADGCDIGAFELQPAIAYFSTFLPVVLRK